METYEQGQCVLHTSGSSPFRHHELCVCVCVCPCLHMGVYVRVSHWKRERKNVSLLKGTVYVIANWIGWAREHSCYAIYLLGKTGQKAKFMNYLNMVGADTVLNKVPQGNIFSHSSFHFSTYSLDLVFTYTTLKGDLPRSPLLTMGELFFLLAWHFLMPRIFLLHLAYTSHYWLDHHNYL